jgi:peptidyl-prolyl cis-trans isomerase A (cyclophilin A)
MLALGFALATGATGALEVDFVTTRGTVTATMEYDKAPRAVANLLTLAQGTRGWVDSRTGKVLAGSFFTGQTFFRVVNQAAEKTLETGSIHGDPADEPGFGFADEFDASLTHEPYVLSLSNRGPNTNGARFVITGNAPLPERDGRHTVFGRVPGAPSRAVVDAILAAGANATAITAVVVRRTDPAAAAFDESAVPLPVAHGLSPQLKVTPGVAVEWFGIQPVGSVLRAHQSLDLTAWSPHYRNFVGLDDTPPVPSQRIDGATVPSRFYHFSLVTNPDADGVSGMGGRTLTLEGPGFDTLVYQFNPQGTGGSYENIIDPEIGFVIRGEFLVSALESPLFEPHAFRLLLFHEPPMGGAAFTRIRGGADSAGPTLISGHHQTLLMDSNMSPVFEDLGPLELTRP